MVEVAVFRLFFALSPEHKQANRIPLQGTAPGSYITMGRNGRCAEREREGWKQLADSFSKPRASNKYPVSVRQERKKEGKKDVQVSEVAGTVLGRISSPSPFPSRERVCVERMELLLLFAMLFFAVRRLRNKNGNS